MPSSFDFSHAPFDCLTPAERQRAESGGLFQQLQTLGFVENHSALSSRGRAPRRRWVCASASNVVAASSVT